MTKANLSYSIQLAATIAGCMFCSAALSAEEQTDQMPPWHVEHAYDSNTETSSIGRSENVESKLSAEFADFLGNEERASRVVEGLRTGDEFRLSGRHKGGDQVEHHETNSQTTSVDGRHDHRPPSDGGYRHNTIDPPTDSMGYGNVRLTLNLAEARLTQLGISQPTNKELSAILVGGKIDGVHVEGILNERAAGAGWGEIAQRYDFKVGQLMGNGKVSQTVVMPHDGSGHHVRPRSEEHVSTGSVDEVNTAPIAQPGRHAYRSNGYIPSGKAGVTSSASSYKTQGAGAEKHAVRRNGYIPSGKAGITTPASAYKSPGAGAKKHAVRRNGYIPSGAASVTTATNQGNAGFASFKGNGAKKNGYIPSGSSHARGAGIVSAHGVSMTGQGGIKSGHANGHSKGYVPSGAGSHSVGVISANNGSVSASAHSAGGRGHGKGHGKHK